jgi:hypothetical protein
MSSRIELIVTTLSVVLALVTLGCIVFALCYKIESGKAVVIDQAPPQIDALPAPHWKNTELLYAPEF